MTTTKLTVTVMVTVGDRFLLSASPITPLLSHYITDTAPACVVPSLRIHTALHPRLPTINTFNDFPQFPPSAWPASASFQSLLCIPWQQAFMRSAPPQFIDSTRNRHELPAEHDFVCTHPRAAKRPFHCHFLQRRRRRRRRRRRQRSAAKTPPSFVVVGQRRRRTAAAAATELFCSRPRKVIQSFNALRVHAVTLLLTWR